MYGLVERNERGDFWVDWCTTHEQVIMNTWFQHEKRKFDLLRTDDEYTTQFQRHISEHMEGINIIDNVEDRYIKFRNALTESAQKARPDVDRTAKQK